IVTSASRTASPAARAATGSARRTAPANSRRRRSVAHAPAGAASLSCALISAPPAYPGRARRSSIDREDAAADVPRAAIDLDLVVLAVEIIDDANLAVVRHPGIGIAQVPAPAIISHDQLRAPCPALIFAHRGTDARGGKPIAIDHDQPPVGQAHQAAGRAEIVDAREEAPGPPAIVAGMDLGPH